MVPDVCGALHDHGTCDNNATVPLACNVCAASSLQESVLTVQERTEQLQAIARLETSRPSLAEFEFELYDLETDLTPIQGRIEALRDKGMVTVLVFDNDRDHGVNGVHETVVDDYILVGSAAVPSANSTLQERDAESRGATGIDLEVTLDTEGGELLQALEIIHCNNLTSVLAFRPTVFTRTHKHTSTLTRPSSHAPTHPHRRHHNCHRRHHHHFFDFPSWHAP